MLCNANASFWTRIKANKDSVCVCFMCVWSGEGEGAEEEKHNYRELGSLLPAEPHLRLPTITFSSVALYVPVFISPPQPFSLRRLMV